MFGEEGTEKLLNAEAQRNEGAKVKDLTAKYAKYAKTELPVAYWVPFAAPLRCAFASLR